MKISEIFWITGFFAIVLSGQNGYRNQPIGEAWGILSITLIVMSIVLEIIDYKKGGK